MRLRVLTFAATVVGLCALASGGTSAQQITGAGSTFVYPVISKWSVEYSKVTHVEINYQSIGSGGGIAQIKAGTVDFGASDAPLSPSDLRAAGLAQFPVVIGGIIPVVNLPDLKPGDLKMTGQLLADIYLGKVRKWDDPAIKQVNPELKLPGTAITVVHRSDGSGTTFNWVDYLSKVSPEWKTKVGEGTSVSWPAGVGGKGNEGVAAYVERIKGSIGYVEYAYVVQNKMTWTLVQNAAGDFVRPERPELSDRCGKRRLGACAGLRPRHDQRAGQGSLPDRGDDVHPDVQAAQGRAAQQDRHRLLQVVARARAGDRIEPRLCAAPADARDSG